MSTGKRVWIRCVCLAIATGFAAGQAPTPPEKLGWWMKSSLSDKPMATKVLYHLQGTFSYMHASGNTEGTALDTKVDFQLRKWRFTDSVTADYGHKDLAYGGGGGTVLTTESTMRNHLAFDITKYLTAVAGIENYKNTLMLTDKRLTVYGGLGAQLVDKEKQHLFLVAGMGHTNFEFDRAAMLRINPAAVDNLHTTSPDSAGILLMQNWSWKITPTVTFRQDGSYMDFNAAQLGNRWTLGFDVDVAIAKRFSLSVGYQARHEDNAFIRALLVKPYDRTFTTGIRFTL